MRIGENQQHLATTEIREREVAPTIQAGQVKVRRGRAGLQPIAFDLAARQGTLAEPRRPLPFDLCILHSICRFALPKRHQRLRPYREFTRNLSFRVNEITRGCPIGFVCRAYFHVLLKQYRRAHRVLIEELEIRLLFTRADEQHRRMLLHFCFLLTTFCSLPPTRRHLPAKTTLRIEEDQQQRQKWSSILRCCSS